MGWIRIDDRFDEHPKLARVGPLAWGVWLAGLAYCNRNLTDGFIPYAKARLLASFEVIDDQGRIWTLSRTSGIAGEDIDAEWVIGLLVEAGLWEPVSNEQGVLTGYQVHDYADYQPSRDEVMAQRAAAQERMARARARKRVEPDSEPVPEDVRSAFARTSREQVENVERTSDEVPEKFALPQPQTQPQTQEKTTMSSSPDFDGVVDAWNRICAGEGPGPPLPEVLGVTKQRRLRFALRCRELARSLRDGDAVNELGWWERLFERVRASPFLRGEGEAGWQATLDWLLEDVERVVRVLEGAYDARASPVAATPRARAPANGAVTPERLAELEARYGADSDLPPSELMRREREAIAARKRREEA